MRALVVLATAVALLAGSPARAEPFGWRIEVQACRGEACTTLKPSRRRWGALYACQGRAGLIERLGEAPRGRTLRARCVSVDGVLGA